MAVILLTSLRTQLEAWKPEFWLESVAVIVFGTAWLIKGETFLTDRVI